MTIAIVSSMNIRLNVDFSLVFWMVVAPLFTNIVLDNDNASVLRFELCFKCSTDLYRIPIKKADATSISLSALHVFSSH